MTRLMLLCAAPAASLVLLLPAAPAQAAGSNYYSYVSNTGSDSNNCSTPATACSTFNHALSETANYGEIDCVNEGYYGGSGFTVAQSVTIDCTAALGTAAGQINVDGAGVVVRLRNLSINGEGEGLYGIDAQNMAALYIENCLITNFNPTVLTGSPYLGIKFEPSASPSQLFVTNSIISENGKSGSVTGGIDIIPGSGVEANVTIDRTRIEGNSFGIIADGTNGGIIRGTVSDSVVSGNANNGITVSTTSSNVVLLIDQTKVAGNNFGLVAAGSNAGMLVRNSSVIGNATGLDTGSGGVLYSYGNNSVNGNTTTDGAFTGTVGLK